MEANTATLTAVYNYKERLNIWRNYSAVNKVVTDCGKCSKIHCHKSLLLDNGKHICWFCWIRRDSNLGQVVVKPHPKSENSKAVKIQSRNKPLQPKKETKKVSEIEVLEEALSTVDNIVDEPAYETELTKLANAVLVNHAEPSPLLNARPAPVILETKTMDTKNNKAPSIEEKNSQKVAPSTVAVETKSTEKTKAAADKNQYQEMPEVVYSKFNPYMAQFGIQETKWKKVTWNVVKYGLALLLAIFAIISLYFTSLWQNVNDSGFLMNLEIISSGASSTGTNYFFNLADLSMIPGISADYAEFTSFAGDQGIAKMLSSLALYDLNPAFSEGALNSLIAFSIISIIAVFPLLVFKNGTVCSVSFIGAGLVLAIIIITLFSIGMAAQNIFVAPFRNISNAASSYGAQPNDVLVTRINDDLRALLNALKLPA